MKRLAGGTPSKKILVVGTLVAVQQESLSAWSWTVVVLEEKFPQFPHRHLTPTVQVWRCEEKTREIAVI